VTAAALVARLLLSGVFAVAAAAKLADRAGTRAAVREFGVPARVAGALAFVLPLAELTSAGLLLPASTALAGAILAASLLVLFTAAIAANLLLGRSPSCHCFGQLHSEPVGWKTLGRNGALVGLAAFAAFAGLAESEQRSATAWIGRLEGAELLALAVGIAAVLLLVLGTLAFVSFLRSYGRVLIRLERVEAALGIQPDGQVEPEVGLTPGTPAPELAEVTELLEAGRPVLLLFTSPRCGPCRALLADVARWQREHGAALTVALASDGKPEDVRAEAEEFELEHVIVDDGRQLYEAFGASGTPSAVLIGADGRVASWVASGREWIERLLEQAVDRSEDVGLPIGAETPALELPSLDGDRVALADLRGRETLLLFWNPDCGFCRSMHDELLAWERSVNGDLPRLVIVSAGDAESTRAEGFTSAVLLDEAFAAGDAFGAGGTPMAVLLDADGRVASSVIAGRDAVLALARGATSRPAEF
jgi:thiol-disulfide isomerase/thioredoxin